MPASIAILSDLGWAPVLDHLDGLRLDYFNYLCQMGDAKVGKYFFNILWEQQIESGCEVFKYFSNRDIYIRAGMDHDFSKHSNVTVTCFKESMFSSRQHNSMFDLNNYDSLCLYKYVKHDVYPFKYLMLYNHIIVRLCSLNLN